MSSSKTPVLPVIMAGGSGTRLWPLSRAGYPKQFLVLSGNESLFQLAARRLAALASPEFELAGPCIVGNDEHRFLVLDQLRETQQRAPRAAGPQHRPRAHAGGPGRARRRQ
jgi:mannose-1-phosphate guanylyltransferase/mannose-6-phosphate isomerase